jgi:ferredoxin
MHRKCLVASSFLTCLVERSENMPEKQLRVRVDQERCQGHNRCKAIAPHLFDLDEFGTASAANGGLIAPKDHEAVKLAIDNCPEFAIKIVEE